MIKPKQSSSSSQKSKNFKVPNFNRVLHCYDVPGPINHLTGYDPVTFLNTNSPDEHCGFKPMNYDPITFLNTNLPDEHCGFKPISPMYVDPCVLSATFCEIFSKTTDLTALEHAGVTLSDQHTTAVSTTTPVSSADSEVLADQETAYHLDEFQPLSPIDEPEKNNQDLVHNEAADDDSLFYDSILDFANIKIPIVATKEVTEVLSIDDQAPKPASVDTTLPGPSSGLTQNFSEEHKVNQPNQAPKPASVDKTLPGPSNGLTQNFSEEHKVNQPRWCDVCKAICTNDFNRHVTGQKHLKNLKKSNNKPNPPSAPVIERITNNDVGSLQLMIQGENTVNPIQANSLHCELCDVFCNSNDALQTHISGKKHQRKLKRPEPLFGHSLVSATVNTPLNNPSYEEGETSKRKAEDPLTSDDEDVNTKKQKMADGEEEEEPVVMITCKLCNVVCNDAMGFRSHLASKEHSAMARKQAEV